MKSKYSDLINEVNKARDKMLGPIRNAELSTWQLKEKMYRNRRKTHNIIIKKMQKKLNINLDDYEHEHAKARKLMIKHLKKTKQQLKETFKYSSEEYHKTLRAVKKLKNKYEYKKGNPSTLYCLWFAENGRALEPEVFGGASYSNSHEIIWGEFGENNIEQLLFIENAGGLGTSVKTRIEFTFAYEPDDNGVAAFDIFIHPIGIATFESSDTCGWWNHSEAGGRFKIYASVAQRQFNELKIFPEETWELFDVRVEEGDTYQNAVSGERLYNYAQGLPILANEPCIITVGIEATVWSGGSGNSAEFDFFGNGSIIKIPSVWVNHRS